MQTALSALPRLAPTLGGASTVAPRSDSNQDLFLGGAGALPGLFGDPRQIVFDSAGKFYTLEGPNSQTDLSRKTTRGNARLQAFSDLGAPLKQWSLKNVVGAGAASNPFDLAVTGSGPMIKLWVSFPNVNCVVRLDPTGNRLKIGFDSDTTLPGGVGALTTWRDADGSEKIALIARGTAQTPATRIYLLNLNGTQNATLTLSQGATDVRSLDSLGNDGDFYLRTPSEILRFDSSGALLETLPFAAYDLALDPANGALVMLSRNFLVRVAPPQNGQRVDVKRREARLSGVEYWNPASSPCRLAYAPDGRLWAMPLAVRNSTAYSITRPRPFVMRVKPEFAALNGVVATPYKVESLDVSLLASAPYNVSYDPSAPFGFTVRVASSTTDVRSVRVAWKAVTDAGAILASGEMPTTPLLPQGALNLDSSFTPGRYGAFSLQARVYDAAFATDTTLYDHSYNGEPDGETAGGSGSGALLKSVALHGGVALDTREMADYTALPVLETSGVWKPTTLMNQGDPAKAVWSGLPLVRLYAGQSESARNTLAQQIARCREVGARFWVQFTNESQLSPAVIEANVSRFKDVVTYWEVVNEPTNRMKATTYLNTYLKPVYTQIKALAPNAKVLAPNMVSMDISQTREFLQAGGAAYFDVWSQHDYEAHETVERGFWQREIASIKALLDEFGAGDKPIWQTERAIGGLRNGVYQGRKQASNCLLHRDIWDEAGTPNTRNWHFYLQDHGYDAIPSYLWSAYGPHAAAFALRVREANLGGARFVANLDFGATGNTLFHGLVHRRRDGAIRVTLRTLGLGARKVAFAATGAAQMKVCDAWGNETTAAAAGAALWLELSPLPIYLHLPPGATLAPQPLDLGLNLVGAMVENTSDSRGRHRQTLQSGAGVTWSGTRGTQAPFGKPLKVPAAPDARLFNASVESFHSTDLPYPYEGRSSGSAIWMGNIPAAPDAPASDFHTRFQFPQTLTWEFPTLLTVGHLILRGVEADNQFAALLDFNVEAYVDDAWQVVARQRSTLAPSDAVRLKKQGPDDATSAFDYGEAIYNFWLSWPALKAHALRLRVLRTTFGQTSDGVAAAAMWRQWRASKPPRLMLSEIEMYGGSASPPPASPRSTSKRIAMRLFRR